MPVDIPAVEFTASKYPSALREAMADVGFRKVWAIGNLSLFAKPLVGFFCSKRCPGEVILRVYDLARSLRDADATIISGFHTPMEKECLDLLLRGTQPIVICPARSIERMRIPTGWRRLLTEGRLLILSPFEANEHRPTIELAEKRNRLVAALSDAMIVVHTASGSRTERLCLELAEQGKLVYTLKLAENARLIEQGIAAESIDGLLKALHEIIDSPRVQKV